MALAKNDDILRRLQESCDLDYYESVYRQCRYAFGEAWTTRSQMTVMDGGMFPHFPDVSVKQQAVGQSKRILTAAYIGMSKTAYSQPCPEFPQASFPYADVMQQYVLQRGKDDRPGGEWGIEDAMVYMDGSGLGYGGAQVCLYDNPRTNLQYVGVKHVPTYHILRDWSVRNPARTPWICFCTVLSEDDAYALLGTREKVEQHVTSLYDYKGFGIRRAVRVFEYYDVGINGADPTRALIVGDITEKPFKREANPYGDDIPFAPYVHFVAPGMRYPIGRILLQMPVQEALNEVERYIREILRRPPVDIVDLEQIEDDSWKLYASGNKSVPLKSRSKDGRVPPFLRIGGAESQQTLFMYKEMLEREATATSGTTDFDRGTLSGEDRTLGENQLVDARSQVQGSWDRLQMSQYQMRKIKKVLKYGKMYDLDPVHLPIDGDMILYNDPEDPNMRLSNWIREDTEIKISEDSLAWQDHQRERMAKSQELMALADLIGRGLDERRWTEERVKNAGYDPKDMLLDEAEMVPQGGMGGMPPNPLA
jgi:hypothetical protein